MAAAKVSICGNRLCASTSLNFKTRQNVIWCTIPRLFPISALPSYLQQRATVLAKDNRDATGRVALELRIPTTVLYFFDAFVRVTSRYIQPHLEVRFFSEREAAVTWVEAALQVSVTA